MEELLLANAPLLVRNNSGRTAVDVAMSGVKLVFATYMRDNHHKLQVDYGVIEKHAKKIYSGAHPIIKCFAIGHPGAGKSTFIESLKREGSLWRITETSVPPHGPQCSYQQALW